MKTPAMPLTLNMAPPAAAPAAMADCTDATTMPPALSAWSGRARATQFDQATGTPPNARPQIAISKACPASEAGNSTSASAATPTSAGISTRVRRRLRCINCPASKVPAKFARPKPSSISASVSGATWAVVSRKGRI